MVPQDSPPKPCAQLSLPPYVPHAPPISFFSTLSPTQYWVSSTEELSSSLCNFLHSPVIPSPLGPKYSPQHPFVSFVYVGFICYNFHVLACRHTKIVGLLTIFCKQFFCACNLSIQQISYSQLHYFIVISVNMKDKCSFRMVTIIFFPILQRTS